MKNQFKQSDANYNESKSTRARVKLEINSTHHIGHKSGLPQAEGC